MCFATTVRTVSTSQLPNTVRTWGVFGSLTFKCASRHNSVQFCISHLARWLRTRRFSKPTFRPSGATNHWKNALSCDFSTFSRTCIFFLLALFFDILSSSLLGSDSSPLCFPTDHIVGNLTSKLPSVMLYFCVFINILCTCSTKQRKRPVTPQQAACSLIVSAVEPSMWSGQKQPARTRHSA